MRVQLGCYECVLKRALRLAGLMSEDSEERMHLLDIMLKTMLDLRPHCSTPEISGELNRIFVEHTGIADFFKRQKHLSTLRQLALAGQMYLDDHDDFWPCQKENTYIWALWQSNFVPEDAQTSSAQT